MKKILIHDAHNACWRLMKSLPVLTSNGKHIQVVYGFLRLLRSSIEEFSPNIVVVCWDSGYSKYRKQLFKDYKSNRDHSSTPELHKEHQSFEGQKTVIRSILGMLNVRELTYPESEADDLIAMACEQMEGQKLIVSSDMDMLQLVDKDVRVWNPKPRFLYTEDNFFKEVGLTPSQYLQMKALIGDSSDNIPGVAKGFGKTTAIELIKQYGSVENLFSPSIEKKVSKKGNRYKLLYSEGARSTTYRNLTLMDLKVVASHNPDAKEIKKLIGEIPNQACKVNKPECISYFKENAFKSLLLDFATWILPFENLDF